jgi:fructose-bisphosphate aldolase class I
LPTNQCIEENMENLARYSRIVQEIGLVPIVEPEVLLNGSHSIQKSQEVTEQVLKTLFKKLEEFKVYIPGVILKTSMVINGDQNPNESSAEEVAEKTIETLLSSVPKNIGGVVFLSGGQTAVEATAHLDKIAEIERDKGLPFEIAFSYARAIQDPALRAWQGKKENIPAAREQFKNRLELNQLADSGDYDINLEYLD